MIVLEVATQNPTQMLLVQHDHVAQAFSPDGTDHPFDVWIFPRRTRGHIVHLFDRLQFVGNRRAICCRPSTADHEPLPPSYPIYPCRMGQPTPAGSHRVPPSRESITS